MKIQFDHNHLLTIFNENIPQTKEYAYSAGGYIFSDFDKGLIVLHKKDFKITNLKNLWDGMNVVYIKNSVWEVNFSKDHFEDALRIFQWFNEETGEKYGFIPNIQEKDLIEKNNSLQKLGSKCTLRKTEKWVFVDSLTFTITGADELSERMSSLFGLVVMYGKFESKNWELLSCKVQLPLFGQYLNIQEKLDDTINKLSKIWVFIKVDKLTNKNGITYQISSNDYELLEICAKRYEPVEKFEKISKRDFTQDMKIKLIEFLETNQGIPSEWKAEVLEQIKNGTIKFLMK